MPDSDRIADRLYGLDLEDFTAQRNEAVKELRAKGRRDEAQAIRELRKPTIPAWAVNQVARSRKPQVKALVRAGDQLRKAQTGTGVRGRAALRQAITREREAVERLVEGAAELLAAGDHAATEATLQKVRETLHAAAGDDEVRRLVSAGQLTREARSVGLGALAAGSAAREPAPRSPRPRSRGDLAGARRKAQDAKAVATRLQRELTQAKRRLERAEAARDRAIGTARDAASDVSSGQRRLADARKQADKAERDLRRMQD